MVGSLVSLRFLRTTPMTWDIYKVLRSDTGEMLFSSGVRHEAVRKAIKIAELGVSTYIIDTKGYVVKTIEKRILE